MTEFQYCYWLMGVIELGSPTSLNERQLFLVKEHLDLVKDREYAFCNWLDGFLSSNEEDNLSPKKLEKIINKLNQEFRDVIDSSYDNSIFQELNAAHNFKKKNTRENHQRDLLC